VAPVEFGDVMVGHALVTFSRASMVEAVRASTRAILIATVSLTLLAVIMAFFLSKRASRPIYDLMTASKAIGQGRLDYRLTGRRKDELGTLFNSFNEMAQGLYEKGQVERVLSRYVAPSVAREVLRNLEHVELGGKHVNGTVLFADIAGFTHLSEDLSPSEVASFLNEYFGYVTQVAQLYRGTIDKFIGDCAMVVFGVPERDADHKFNAIACAVLIRRLTECLNEIRIREGKSPVYFRIGINTGEMLAGNMGSHDRMQYTVVGDAVNLASRVLDLAAQGEIIIREEHYRDPDVQRRVIARRHHRLRVRGRSTPITIYLVKDVASSYRRVMDEQLEMLLGHRVT
jgi:adenylate cyclase